MTIDVNKALQHRLVFLVGEEEVLRRRALDDLLSGAGLAKDDFDLQTFVADSVEPMEWLGSAGTSPFMAERRTVVVRNALRVDPEKLSDAGFKSLPESALLVLVADDEAGSDDKIQRMKTTVRQRWEKLVKAAGGVTFDFAPDPKRSKESVLAEVKRAGKAMTPAAADALIEMTGGSLSRAVEEIEKILLFIGDEPQIKEGHVREIVVPSREWNVFRMVESTLEGKVPEALRQLRVLVASNAKAEEIAQRSILPVVSNQLKLVWQARVLLDAGVNLSNAPSELLAQFPARPNLAKEKEWRANRSMAMARGVTLPKLRACFQILSDTDARLKGLLNSFEPYESLETMLLEMAGTLSQKTRAR